MTGYAIGYVNKGPMFGNDDRALRTSFFEQLCKLARSRNIIFLAIQPPQHADYWISDMEPAGFRKSTAYMGPTATVILDLSSSLDYILARMKRQTRYNINLGLKKGLIISEGTAKDIGVYYKLLQTTAKRQGFSTYPGNFFDRMFETFSEKHQIKLFIAHFQERIVAAQIILAFGSTVINRMSVWSGQDSGVKPNEAIQWNAIKWAKNNGYQYYDFEGIDPIAAKAVLSDSPVPDCPKQTLAYFKLGFGGKVVLLPGVYDYIYDSSMRSYYDHAMTDFGQPSMML